MHRFTYIIILLSVLACTEPITFESGSGDNILVVDGFITNQPGPHYVILSFAASYASILKGGHEVPATGATMFIEDEAGTMINLTERTPGSYLTPDSFQGETGRKYTLHITAADGRRYVSTPQEVQSSGQIDSVYWEFAPHETARNRFTVNYTIDYSFTQPEQYYKWGREETYLFPTLCKVRTERQCDTFPGHLVDINVPTYCYPTDTIPANFINLSAAEDFTTTQIFNHELSRIDFDFKYSYRHSLNVLQYSIGAEAYQYWKLIERQLTSTGSIFDPSPVRLTGNLRNVENDDDVILGYFGAYGLSSQRIFIDITDLPFAPEAATCPDDIVIFHEEFRGNFCDDCRWWAAGTGEKPDFWVD